MSQELSATKKFKKSTARFVRNEVKKTKHSVGGLKVFVLEILFGCAFGLTLSYSYVYYLM